MGNLKPCPMCGNEPRTFSNGSDWVIACFTPGCGVRLSSPKNIRSQEEIAEAWNKRFGEEKLLAEINSMNGQIKQEQSMIDMLQQNQSRLYQAFVNER